MLDFLIVSTRSPKRGQIEVYPKFKIGRTEDLMIRGGDFYAVWVEERGLWSTDEQDVIDLVDKELSEYAKDLKTKTFDQVTVAWMWDSTSGSIDSWHRFCQGRCRDIYHSLDEKLVFSNDPVNKKDYASQRLPYALEPCDISNWDKLIGTLYNPEERHKLEWGIGSVVSGDSKSLQKFFVLYGSAGTGKSTILNVIQKLFEGYYTTFDSKALGSANASFALESFRSNPLVGIQHDGDLSRIEDNTRINSLVSHELMPMNEKYKQTYNMRFNAILFMGTNKPVKITDAKSGLIRRLIDVSPSGEKLPVQVYNKTVKGVAYELGGIACHCRDVYEADPHYYDDYIPMSMMEGTNDTYNFLMDCYPMIVKYESIGLSTLWKRYLEYIEENRVPYPLSRRLFNTEIMTYFGRWERVEHEGSRAVETMLYDFRTDLFSDSIEKQDISEEENGSWLKFEYQPSLLDTELAKCPAQYASRGETPQVKWADCKTTLKDLDTGRLHYVKPPINHIVIDFDLKNSEGKKDPELNAKAASEWPPTYAELSKSGGGIHLHYIYTGDVSELSDLIEPGIEVKIFTGGYALRRRLSKCVNLAIAVISSGLKLKERKKAMINIETTKDEAYIRKQIRRALDKEVHPDTSSNINWIKKVLDDAYASGEPYNVSDLHGAVLTFAARSTNQSERCVNLVSEMKFKNIDEAEAAPDDLFEAPIMFFDIEVFPNLLLVNWKYRGKNAAMNRMINPKPEEVSQLFNLRMIGFNNRRYDNHILWGASLGYSNEELYHLSQSIINSKKGDQNDNFFANAYNLSYTDIFDFASTKQSLKKWEIDLGLHHEELGLPWDEPVPEELWDKVSHYCDNDVLSTEAVFDHLEGDWTARKILADLAGMSVNTPTNTLTTKIIFGNDRNPELVYTDLATGKATNPEYERDDIITAFPGYEYTNVPGKAGKRNMYRGTDVGRGGYIISNPGIYYNVALLDVASLHPNSIRAMNCFGKYTKRFTDLVDTRLYIKHKDYEAAKQLFDGKLAKYLTDDKQAKQLSKALKIAINSVYGLTSAKFDTKFRDPRNVNNIVALRGALFMRTLQDEVESRGFKIVAIKTDSIKIANATEEIVNYCLDFATKYGYTFEYEANYDRICQINDADYIAQYSTDPINGDESGKWTSTGAFFSRPYVFKTLFSHEDIVFDDLCEVFEVKGAALYLDTNEGYPDDTLLQKALEKASQRTIIDANGKKKKAKIDWSVEEKPQEVLDLEAEISKCHDYNFIGRIGRFTPVRSGAGGGRLVVLRDGKYDSASGAKGTRWKESETLRELDIKDQIDIAYFNAAVDDAIDKISDYGDFENFVGGEHEGVPPYTAAGDPFEDDLYVPFNVR